LRRSRANTLAAMILRLLTGILAAVFLPLGVVFVVLGLVVEHPDRGRPEDFVYIGAPFAVAGVALAATFIVLWRREAGRRRRRRQGLRTGAEVVRAELDWRVRVNGRPMLRLTVRLPGAISGDATVSGAFVAGDERLPVPGARIDVVYDPAEPSNFEPAPR
jgi:hypothetical protein